MANFIQGTAKISALSVIDISTRGTHTYIGEGCVIDDFVKIKHVGGAGDIKNWQQCVHQFWNCYLFRKRC